MEEDLYRACVMARELQYDDGLDAGLANYKAGEEYGYSASAVGAARVALKKGVNIENYSIPAIKNVPIVEKHCGLSNEQWRQLTDAKKAEYCDSLIRQYMDCPEREKLIKLKERLER
jgi:hypothetical protein